MDKHPIRFGVQTAQQNIAWEQLRSFWAKADGWAYDSLWVFDHFYPIFSPDPAGTCMEGWTVLSALSQVTKRARIGALVNGNTYRNPALTAKMAATLDNLSGGRLNLGLGAGWFEGEHHSLGFDFKTIPGRLQALDESCQIIKGMFTQEKTTLKGKHYNVVDAICNPKPMQKNLPLMIGGHGEKVLLKIVAKYADMWNMGNADAAEMKRLIGVIERHGDTVGRNTDEIEKTLALVLQGAQAARRNALISGWDDGANYARAGARSDDHREQAGVRRQARRLHQGGRHPFHFSAQPTVHRRRRPPGLRGGYHPAVPFAVKLQGDCVRLRRNSGHARVRNGHYGTKHYCG